MFLLSFIFIALIIKLNLRIIFHIWSCYLEFQCWVSMLSSNQTSNQFLCNLQDAHHLQKHSSRLLESFFIFKLLVLSQSLSRIIWADCSNFSEVHFQFLLSFPLTRSLWSLFRYSGFVFVSSTKILTTWALSQVLITRGLGFVSGAHR